MLLPKISHKLNYVTAQSLFQYGVVLIKISGQFHPLLDTAMNVISRELTNGHETLPSITVVTGRHDLSQSGRSADIFTPSITPRLIFSKSITNWQSVTIHHGREGSSIHDPSQAGRSADIFTTHHNTAQKYFLSPSRTYKRSPNVTICHGSDGLSRSVLTGTIRRHFHHTP